MWEDHPSPLPVFASDPAESAPTEAAIGLLPPQTRWPPVQPRCHLSVSLQTCGAQKPRQAARPGPPLAGGLWGYPIQHSSAKTAPIFLLIYLQRYSLSLPEPFGCHPSPLKAHGRACGQAGDGMAPLTCLQAACPPPLSGSRPGTGSLLAVHQWVSVPILYYYRPGPKLVLGGKASFMQAIIQDRSLKAGFSLCYPPSDLEPV